MTRCSSSRHPRPVAAIKRGPATKKSGGCYSLYKVSGTPIRALEMPRAKEVHEGTVATPHRACQPGPRGSVSKMPAVITPSFGKRWKPRRRYVAQTAEAAATIPRTSSSSSSSSIFRREQCWRSTPSTPASSDHRDRGRIITHTRKLQHRRPPRPSPPLCSGRSFVNQKRAMTSATSGRWGKYEAAARPEQESEGSLQWVNRQ